MDGEAVLICGIIPQKVSKMPTKTYVEFSYPGFFFSEYGVKEVLSRDVTELEIPESAFAFRFFDIVEGEVDGTPVKSGRLNVSALHYYGGRFMSLEEVAAEVPDSDILQDNMRINDWAQVIRCRTGNFQPFSSADIYVPER